MIRDYSKFDTKFRAWDNETKKIYGDITNLVGFIRHGNIIMQPIGAKDKTGKDIFELDVCNCGGDNGVVCYDSVRVSYFIMMEDNDFFTDCSTSENDWLREEVVGTIFDEQHKDLYDKVKEKLGL